MPKLALVVPGSSIVDRRDTDFGMVAMLLPIFGIGWVLGKLYRWQVGRPGESAVYGAAIATFLIIHAAPVVSGRYSNRFSWLRDRALFSSA